MSTEIQWTDETWNPVTGCSKVSPGCAHCYAEVVAGRFWAKQYPPVMPVDIFEPSRPRQFTNVQCHEDRLDAPRRWKKPRKVFVNSMSDLFHEDVPDAFIDKVFAVMALAPQHTFQVLTKRAERMRQYMIALDRAIRLPTTTFPRWRSEAEQILNDRSDTKTIVTSAWPLPNVWLGVSVENQHFADERIPLLLQTPAAVRFISAEPLLGPIDLTGDPDPCRTWLRRGAMAVLGLLADRWQPPLDWVIVGGESGTGARPFDIAWARSIVKQCQATGVPVFVKQLGASPVIVCPSCNGTGTGKTHKAVDFCNQCLGCHRQSVLLADRKGGDIVEWPEDLRVREMPVGSPT